MSYKRLVIWCILLVFSPLVLVIWLLIKLGDLVKALDDLERQLREEIKAR